MKSEKNNNHFDFAFCGFGVSTCLLLRELARAGLLEAHSVCIFEPADITDNEKTLGFWAEEESDVVQLNKDIISKSWRKSEVSEGVIQDLDPLSYHKVNTSDLYSSVFDIIEKYEITVLLESVADIQELDVGLMIHTDQGEFLVQRIFDSRPPKKTAMPVLQSFLGMKIRVREPTFNDETMVLMDFSVPQDGQAQFVHILHESSHTAFLEFTRFSKIPLPHKTSRHLLHKYIVEKYGQYSVISQEHGILPMVFQTPEAGPSNLTSIGARAGAIKPTTGYGFTTMFEQSREICTNPNQESVPIVRKSRFRFYDRLLIDILDKRPELGKPIFMALQKTQPVSYVMSFLQERSTIKSELLMFLRLPWLPFLWAAARDLIWQLKMSNRGLLLTLLVATYLLGNTVSPEIANFALLSLLALGLFLIGIPHGAFDYKVLGEDGVSPLNLFFLTGYLGLIFGVGVLWLFNPFYAFVLFVLSTAWHFGQTDFKEWNLSNGALSFLWGISLLIILLGPKIESIQPIMGYLGILVPDAFISMSWTVSLAVSALCFLVALILKSKRWLTTVMFLTACMLAPLYVGLGVYFIGQHSFTAWGHMSQRLQSEDKNHWLYALPFSFLAFSIYFVFRKFVEVDIESMIGYAVILTSCITFPHILCMNHFYRQQAKESSGLPYAEPASQ
jgi:lycopene beta-cyclase